MAYGKLTKGFKLSYKASSSATSYTELLNLQTVPDIGGTAESVEVTTFDDEAHMYIAGLLSYGDSIDFGFLHDKTQFQTLQALEGEIEWKLEIPDGDSTATPEVANSTVTFKGEPTVRMDGKTYNEALTYTLSIKPTSSLTWA